MRIFRSIGLGMAIIIITLLMPEVFRAFEDVLLRFLHLMVQMLAISENALNNGATLPASPFLGDFFNPHD